MKEDLKEKGLINKYFITKTNGKQIDPKAEFFVLRYDEHQKCKHHLKACRKALETYANEIEEYLPILSQDLRLRLDVSVVNSEKEKLIDFMTYYKNNVPIGTQKSSVVLVEDYLSNLKNKK